MYNILSNLIYNLFVNDLLKKKKHWLITKHIIESQNNINYMLAINSKNRTNPSNISKKV